jgi:hypothetical protein
LYLSEVYGLLQRIPAVEFVEGVRIEIVAPGDTRPRPAPPRVSLPMHTVICSGQHEVVVTRADE